MTATGLRPVRLDRLSDEERATALEVLARAAADMTWADVHGELACLAHESLSPDARTRAFERYYDAVERADWLDCNPHDTEADSQDTAREWALDRAAEYLFALMHGETER